MVERLFPRGRTEQNFLLEQQWRCVIRGTLGSEFAFPANFQRTQEKKMLSYALPPVLGICIFFNLLFRNDTFDFYNIHFFTGKGGWFLAFTLDAAEKYIFSRLFGYKTSTEDFLNRLFDGVGYSILKPHRRTGFRENRIASSETRTDIEDF